MTHAAQQIAIATACGWKITQINGVWPTSYHIVSPGGDEFEQAWIAHFVPNYLNDLNAMHAAIMSQPAEIQCNIASELDQLVNAGLPKYRNSIVGMAAVVFATAAQRSEAFVRALGKWEEQS